MGTPPRTSVLLPTCRRTDVVSEIVGQLRAGDELLVVCDDDDDPAATQAAEYGEQVRAVPAGDPEGCSGKANAIAVGMDAAAHDRLVWTDDDFYHPEGWLGTLLADYETHGPTTELPQFVGTDPLSYLAEPLYALAGTGGVYGADLAWGGSLVFDRSDIDEAAFLADLRRSVSDDGLLSEFCSFHAVRRVRTVRIGGSIRASLERHVRFIQIAWYHGRRELVVGTALGTLVAVGCLLAPLLGLIGTTLFCAAVYLAFGIRRWTVLLAYPAALAQAPLFVYALARQSFVWGGRRYRWRSLFDVEVIDAGPATES
ncbi:glycosyltransferase [Haloarcula pelagica]|uniref:glycosyltransferase n=1 Tax=Haloarcula pelagica TaxID=3033389 RepID=UPI0024C31976|nr:glycosyltransferase [Halomicroarcula sp. YJ-61-S]